MKKLLLSMMVFSLCLCAFSSKARSLETEHFQIIYQSESENTASVIYRECEQVYERVCSIVGNIGEKTFLPVVIRSDVKSFNAHYTGFPYNMIVINDTFSDSDTALNMSEKMLGVFEHELTHALLFNHRNRFWRGIGDIFCDGLSIQGLYIHPLFSEGLSVYAESRGKEGRLNDPFFMHDVKQAKIDNAFPSWFEAAGGVDYGSLSNSAYSFGGPFVSYLYGRFGEDKFRDFLDVSSKLVFKTNSAIFRDVFGMDIETAWDEFKNSVEIPSAVLKADSLVDSGSYSNIIALKDRIYALDDSESAVKVFDLESGNLLKVFPSYGASNFSLTEDGQLIMGVASEYETYVLFVSESGKIIQKIKDYRQGCVSESGFIGLVKSRKNCTFIDVFSMDGKKKGSLNLGYGCEVLSLSPYGKKYVSFILVKDGVSHIAFADIENGKILIDDNPGNYIFRSLSGNSFSYADKNNPASMVRYGTFAFDGKTLEIQLSDLDYDGGTFSACVCSGMLYFNGRKTGSGGLFKAEHRGGQKSYSSVVREYEAEDYSVKLPYSVFDSRPYIFNGTFIPFAGYSDENEDLAGFGATYISQDPLERWSYVAGAGYSPFDNRIFAELDFVQRLSHCLSFKETGKIKNSSEDDSYMEFDIRAVYSASLLRQSDISCSVFLNPEFNEKFKMSAGSDVTFSFTEKRGNLPFEYLGLSAGAMVSYDITDNDGFSTDAEILLHLPHIFRRTSQNSRFTFNLPSSLIVRTDFNSFAEGTFALVPFAMEIQKGSPVCGMFFNRFVTNAGYSAKYDFEKEEMTDLFFVSADFTFTPSIGMVYGNVFGKLGLELEFENSSDISAKVRFAISM